MMTDIKTKALSFNSCNSNKAETKNYELWEKYKNSFLKAQENDQKKVETRMDLPLKEENCVEYDSYI